MYAYCFYIIHLTRAIRNKEYREYKVSLLLTTTTTPIYTLYIYTSINDDNVSIHNYRKLAPEFKSRYVILLKARYMYRSSFACLEA